MNSYDPCAAKIYVDGSAKPTNPGPAGIAGIIEYPDELNKEPKDIFAEGYEISTNQRMELLSCIRAIEFIVKNTDIANIFIIYTDSMYVCNNKNMVPFWTKNKWVGKDGTSIRNRDLWKEFWRNRQKAKTRIEISWIENKSIEITKRVDMLAKKAASKKTRRKDYGFMPGKVGTSKSKYRNNPSLYPACGEEIIIHAYRKELDPKKKKIIIRFDLFDVDEHDFLYRYKIFIDKKYAHEIKRRHTYKVTLNKDQNYPKIIKFKDFAS